MGAEHGGVRNRSGSFLHLSLIFVLVSSIHKLMLYPCTEKYTIEDKIISPITDNTVLI
jgi:hypothetical protein